MNKGNLSSNPKPYLFSPLSPFPRLAGCVLSLPPIKLSATRSLSMMRVIRHPGSHVQHQFLPSSLDFDELLRKYPNVTKEELEKLRDTSYTLDYFEDSVKSLYRRKETRKIHGGLHVEAGPLVQILSICILPHQVKVNKPLAIYGRIYVKFRHFCSGRILTRDLFNRGCDDPEILSPSGNLTLIFPQPTDNDLGNMCIPLRDTKIIVDVWDATHNVVAQDSFLVEDASEEGVYEKVYLKIVGGTIGSIFVRYVAMPLAAPCYLEVGFFNRIIDKDRGNNINDVLKVYGKIVARYGNTYGNYADEECTLFEKKSHEFEQVTLNPKLSNTLRMSRSWVSFPAYASLIIDIELFDFNTKRPIFKGVVQGSPENDSCHEPFALDDCVFFVNMLWLPRWPRPCRLRKDKLADVESSKLTRHALPTMEVFSIFIGRQKMTNTLKIFGNIQVYSGSHSFDLFRRDEDNAFELPEDSNFLPIMEGSRDYNIDTPIEIKVDLKDVHGNLFIKGIVYWGLHETICPSRYDTQLCSVIQGLHGFGAVQYSIFTYGFQTNIQVSCKPKKIGSFNVYGSFVAAYDTYDYSTRFHKDLFRIVLFEKDEKDMVTLGIDGEIPLSRSIVIVPEDNSALVIEAHLTIVDQLSGVACEVMSHFAKFEVGQDFYSVENEDCIIDIYVEWMAR